MGEKEKRDLSKFRVTSQTTVSKKLFFSEAHEGEAGGYSLALIPLQIGRQYKIENCYLSKTRDESYYAKIEDIKIIDKSTQVDLTKYSAEGNSQEINLTTQVDSINRITWDGDTGDIDFGEYALDLLPTPIPTDEGINNLYNVIQNARSTTTGTLGGLSSIDFSGANSYIIDQLIKPILSKNPASTYLEVNLFSVDKNFLYNLIESITEPFTVKTSSGELTISDRSQLDLLFIPDNLRDWLPRFIMSLGPDTQQSIFNQLDIIGSFSTIDSVQTELIINHEAQKDAILIVPSARPQRYSYNLDEDFQQIYESIENDGSKTFAQILAEFNGTLVSAKDQLTTILADIKTKLEADELLTNTMKAVNIEGIFAFNLKEVEYD